MLTGLIFYVSFKHHFYEVCLLRRPPVPCSFVGEQLSCAVFFFTPVSRTSYDVERACASDDVIMASVLTQYVYDGNLDELVTADLRHINDLDSVVYISRVRDSYRIIMCVFYGVLFFKYVEWIFSITYCLFPRILTDRSIFGRK